MKNSRSTKQAAAFAVSLFALASTAKAAIVCNSGAPMPFVIPATFEGVYVNLITGVFNANVGSVPGWDWGPWGQTVFNQFFPGAPASTQGGVATGAIYNVLAAGAQIGPAQTYSASAQASENVNWQATNTGQFFGIRFWNEGTAAINYGWIQLDSTAPTGHPATIQGYCYQNDGTAITAGTLPVELQSFSVE